MCQNVSNEVSLAWFKFQAKIPSRSGVCVQEDTPLPPLRSLKTKNSGTFGISLASEI